MSIAILRGKTGAFGAACAQKKLLELQQFFQLRNAKVTSSIPVTGTTESAMKSRAWRVPSPFSLGGVGDG